MKIPTDPVKLARWADRKARDLHISNKACAICSYLGKTNYPFQEFGFCLEYPDRAYSDTVFRDGELLVVHRRGYGLSDISIRWEDEIVFDYDMRWDLVRTFRHGLWCNALDVLSKKALRLRRKSRIADIMKHFAPINQG